MLFGVGVVILRTPAEPPIADAFFRAGKKVREKDACVLTNSCPLLQQQHQHQLAAPPSALCSLYFSCAHSQQTDRTDRAHLHQVDRRSLE